ncbi:MAG TPA: GNAT family N-acetyltransferase [Gemmatimonadaceae bacterium]|nr:GNAT family N-acetyltransferase [Gemmatimonadaceae bacterium]
MKARVARASDVPELVRVINLAYRVEDFFIDGDRTDAAEILARMQESNSFFLVIDRENTPQLAAGVLVEIRGTRGYFAMLSVDPALQGNGLGRALIGAIEEHCRAAGCKALDMEIVDLRRELPAFYAAFGFKPTETIPFNKPFKLKMEAQLVLMSKSLHPA